jgi:predicted PurR-regulated permease PerM
MTNPEPQETIIDPIQLTGAEPSYTRIKSKPLSIIATVALIYLLDWGQSFFIILLLGIFTAYTLNPFVNKLEEIKIPRVFGSTIVVIALIISGGYGGVALSGQVESIIAEMPAASKKLVQLISHKKGDPLSNIQKMQIAAAQVEKATSSEDVTPQKKPMEVVIKEQKIKLSDYLWRGSISFAAAIGKVLTIIFLAYFILVSGDMFKRKLVKLTGPTLTYKKNTVHLLQDINKSIQGYIYMLFVTNVLVGLLMWVSLRLFGVENAGAWAVAAGLIHLVPYFGPLATAAATGMAAFMQFNSLTMALLVAGTSMLIATFVGVFITTWMTGRLAKMNATAVFVSLLFFTWLWGFWGMLLGIPIIVILKVISEYIEYLHPVAEILGE